MSTAALPVSVEAELHREVAKYYANPLGFVLAFFPWGKKGTPLEHHKGPDTWQREALTWLGEQVKARKFNGHDAVQAIRLAVSSGHGIGKSVLAAMIVCWIMSTRPFAQGTVTANTITQLSTKTWARIQTWMGMCLTAHWFEVNSERLYHKKHPSSWFCAKQSSKEENSEAFAGQHAENSTSFYINDEDSGISKAIHEVEEGGLTDGEPIIVLLGNATRSSGPFYEAIWGRLKHRWHRFIVDSRTSAFTNKEQIAEWLKDYGEDSDFFRVRVRGLPPNASDAQFIDQERIRLAQKRQVVVMPDEPLVAGVDFAWGGSDSNVVRFRRGLDARSIASVRVPGEFTRDPGVMTNRLADILSNTYDGRQISMMFLDSAGIAGPIATRLREQGFKNVREVNFGADSPHMKYRYYRDFMWGQMKDWLLLGAIDDHPELESDLVGPGLRPDVRQRVWLESKEDMKKRGIDSPDDGDALALTFAAKVGPGESQRQQIQVPAVFGW